MDTWIINPLIIIAGFVGTFAVIRNKVIIGEAKNIKQDERIEILEKFMNNNVPLLTHLSKSENAIFTKLDIHSNSITTMKQQIGQSPTMKEVRDEFVSKEMFKQMEKHMDEKFDRVEMGLTKILEKLDKG